MPVNTWFPRSLSFFGVDFLAYDVFFFAGVAAFFVVFVIESRRARMRRDDAATLGAIIPFAGMAFSFALEYLALGRAGLSLYAAGVGSVIAGSAYALRRRISLLKIGDAAAPAASLAFALMKLGCLIGGCCYGIPTSSKIHAIYYSTAGQALPKVLSERPDLEGVPLIPTQLLVAVLCIVAFLSSFVILPWSKHKNGRRLGVVLGIYTLGRFIIDFYSSSQLLLGPLSANQIFGLVMVIVSAVLII